MPQDLRQHVDRRLAALPRRNARYSPFGVVIRSSAGDLDALLGREAEAAASARLGREARRHRWAFDQFLEIGLPLGETRNADGQPPRRAEGFDRRFGRQAAAPRTGD